MMEIKAFLASSINEFQSQRNEIASFVVGLNNIIINQQLFLDLEVCEEMDSSIALGGKQNEYNEFIKDCHFVIFLFGEKIGQYTMEEFDIALYTYRQKGNPILFPFFRGGNVDNDVKLVKDQIDNNTKFLSLPLVNADYVKFRIILEVARIARRWKLNLELEIKEGYIHINDKKVLSLDNIPAYSKNKEIQNMKLQNNEKLENMEDRLLTSLVMVHDFIATENMIDITKEVYFKVERGECDMEG